jgi:hypothetical protein
MADSIDSSSRTVAQGGAAGRHGTPPASADRAGNVVVEFLDAARSTAESLLEEQKRQVAERVSGLGEALRNAVGPLDRSKNAIIARIVGQAADRVESFARTVRDRRWNDLVADTEDFARRQPALFVFGAVATGFVVGRFLWIVTDRQLGEREVPRRDTTRAVTAAVSSGSGAGDAASNAPLPPSGVEAR